MGHVDAPAAPAGEPAAIVASVVYGAPDGIVERTVTVLCGATLLDAVIASGLLQEVPSLAASPLDLGVYNKPRPPQTLVRAGDRIEVYRSLVVDPKEARRVRAELRKRRRAG